MRPSSAPALEGKAGRSRWELLNKDLAFKLQNFSDNSFENQVTADEKVEVVSTDGEEVDLLL